MSILLAGFCLHSACVTLHCHTSTLHIVPILRVQTAKLISIRLATDPTQFIAEPVLAYAILVKRSTVLSVVKAIACVLFGAICVAPVPKFTLHVFEVALVLRLL